MSRKRRVLATAQPAHAETGLRVDNGRLRDANGGGVEHLDMVRDFNGGEPTSWGRRIFNGANGIAQTSEEASVHR
ncbi:MAG: hypothetical protein M0026_15230 [Nocardiopsaceae bacterium]|nr:hypothetical protein [Nocardiopsaceae bacterium]